MLYAAQTARTLAEIRELLDAVERFKRFVDGERGS
jgi:hypothetical protein